MDKVPFSVYDFFAYLSSGAVVIVAADYVMGLGLLLRKDVPPLLAVVLIVLSYVSGHIVAHFSGFLLEQVLVTRILKKPTAVLLGERPRLALWRWIFRNYYHPLPASTQNRVREQATRRRVEGKGEGLFLNAYALVSANPNFQSRLDAFRNQYGFARNMSFAFILTTFAILAAHWIGRPNVQLRWAVLSAAGGFALLYRYLKFFRQFSYELLLRYAELNESETKTKTVGA